MSGNLPEPILGKHHPQPRREHKVMTWPRLLALRAWAKEVATAEHANVYLVGSVLTKVRPRDIDIAVILPDDAFQERFGPVPSDPEKMKAYMHHIAEATGERCMDAQIVARWRTRIDVKFCPASWWSDKDRLLLASSTANTGAAPGGEGT